VTRRAPRSLIPPLLPSHPAESYAVFADPFRLRSEEGGVDLSHQPDKEADQVERLLDTEPAGRKELEDPMTTVPRSLRCG